MRVRDLRRDDRRFLGRDEPAKDLEVASASGSEVRDVRGRAYIDFVMGWCAGNLGWNRPEIRTRLAVFEGPDYVIPSLLYEPWVEVAELLEELTPPRLERSYRATGGTEAVEIALQIAREYTERDKFLSVTGSYHGNSIGIRSIPDELELPLDGNAVERLDRALSHRQIAAFIMEPIICNLGVAIPSEEFMTGAAEVCAKHGTLFIIDEVATGFGRTGKLFGCEHYNLSPDIMCMAKALTNGCAPMGATITTAEIGDAVSGKLEFYSTYGWHPLACEAAIATLDYWRRQEVIELAHAELRSAQFTARLANMKLPEDSAFRVTFRVKGMAIGIDLPEGTGAEEIVDDCRERGLLIAGEDDQLTLFPALTIDEKTADAGLDILEACIGEALS